MSTGFHRCVFRVGDEHNLMFFNNLISGNPTYVEAPAESGAARRIFRVGVHQHSYPQTDVNKKKFSCCINRLPRILRINLSSPL